MSEQLEWQTAREGAKHAKENYRDFLEKLKSGEIRSVRRGRKFLTTKGWIDTYLLSLEEKSTLVQ